MSLCTIRKRPSSDSAEGRLSGVACTSTLAEDEHPAKRQCSITNLASKSANSLNEIAAGANSEDSDSAHGPLEILRHAQHVLAVETAALSALSTLYATSATAQEGLLSSVSAILASQANRGKIVVCGVGKSGYIAQKLVATCKSLGVAASWLHAAEAVHGDLGDVRVRDTLLLISHSSSTPELHHLLPHLPSSLPLIALTSHLHPSTVPLFNHPSRSSPKSHNILLPAPIPESETASFGVAAPTTSTTVSLAVADMLALGVAEGLCRAKRKGGLGDPEGLGEVFRRNHPGGAIGMGVGQGLAKGKGTVEVGREAGLPSPELSGSDDG